MSFETLPTKSRSTPDTCNKERAEKEERYIVVSNDLPPPETEQACQSYIEQVIQEGIKKGDYVDNIVFQILNLKDVNEATLQAMIQESDDEEKERILERAVQIWERRQRMTEFLTKNQAKLETKFGSVVYGLVNIFEQEMIEDGYEEEMYGEAYYAEAFLLIDQFKSRAKGSQVLDIGAGDGDFLHLLRIHGYEGIGLDRDDGLTSRGRKRGLEMIDGSIFFLPQKLEKKKFPITLSINVLDVLVSEKESGGIHPTSFRGDELERFFQQMAELTEIGGISIHVSGGLEPNDKILKAGGFFEILVKKWNHMRYVVLKRTKIGLYNCGEATML